VLEGQAPSLRQTSAAFAEAGHVTSNGAPFTAIIVQRVL